jgi:hypothetical protein
VNNPTMIKISSTGEQLPDTATAWDAVLLPDLGLMFAADNLSGDELNEDDANAQCQALSLAGFNDWRVPTRPELEAILDLTRYNPAINPDYFRDTESDWYRTSTPLAWSSDSVWFVCFYYGSVGLLTRSSKAFVRPCRSVSAGQ